MTAMEARLERLDRRTRRLQYACGALLALLCMPVLLAAGPAIPDVVQARAFEVIDKSGAPVVQLEADANGGRIWVWNKLGKVTVSMSNSEDSHGVFRLYAHRGNRGQPYAVITADESGGRITIEGAGDKVRVIDSSS